ncbi:uncharacterized protein Z520_04299 [Fonsecaea multimorphosa CBS 102226]|uniref:NAD(P)-binding domain-containing protein n=1 Tax=Fonsecaea multimorphosa CBS 102226 TaxID=1442371 RepID=A0A0D2K8Y1_9EURO|nr:uncharacterized protein Z520_04299 [Fonsecaea multimorphosa CBS 102226]KIX99664.1 hypothetical protein Z520_04299 [Fonsecaea multimorphosa CBS 102226]OAL26716.1 hypothetical protein AYO22_04069 [Fonsecaea multimorphosa]
MKLVISGATGFVATELIRQSLSDPTITSVVALARRPITVPDNLGPGADTSKLESVVLEDFASYPDPVKKQLGDADACIWTLAITPSKSKTVPWDEVYRVCHEYTMAGLEAMFEARSSASRSTPFRFLYMSGVAAERDQTKQPTFMPKYCLMRGETENRVLAFASSHPGDLEVTVAKPGLITQPGSILHWLRATLVWFMISLPSVSVVDISAAMLDQVLNGFEKDPLENKDLIRIGQRVLSEKKG